MSYITVKYVKINLKMNHTFMVKHNNERPAGNVAIGARESKVFENLP